MHHKRTVPRLSRLLRQLTQNIHRCYLNIDTSSLNGYCGIRCTVNIYRGYAFTPAGPNVWSNLRLSLGVNTITRCFNCYVNVVFLHTLHFRNIGVTVVSHYKRSCSSSVAVVTNGKYNNKTLILLLLICSLFCWLSLAVSVTESTVSMKHLANGICINLPILTRKPS